MLEPMNRWADEPVFNHRSQIDNRQWPGEPMNRFLPLKLTACNAKCRLALRTERTPPRAAITAPAAPWGK